MHSESVTLLNKPIHTLQTGNSPSKHSNTSHQTVHFEMNAKKSGEIEHSDDIQAVANPEHHAADTSRHSAHDLLRKSLMLEWKNTKGERQNIAFLFLLYVLQGVPLGLSGSVSLLLFEQNATYSDQTFYSLVIWPFSLKVLWAPIMDSVYVASIGRRKTWLIGSQCLIGATMIGLSYTPDLISRSEGSLPDVETLTLAFLVLNVYTATQDMAVDAWALKLLSHKNVGYQGTCNGAGQSAGVFIGSVLFIVLESPVICDKFRPVPDAGGLVTFSDYLMFWGVIILATTALIHNYQAETHSPLEEHIPHSVAAAYSRLKALVRIDAMGKFVFVAFASKVGFALSDSVANMKLLEFGIPIDDLMLVAVPRVAVQLALPFLLIQRTRGPTPLIMFISAVPYRICIGLWLCIVAYWSTLVSTEPNQYPLWFYSLISASLCAYQVPCTVMLVSSSAFVGQVSDPNVGAIQMTLMAVILNLGGSLWQTALFYVWRPVENRTCTAAEANSDCAGEAAVHACQAANGSCVNSGNEFCGGAILLSVVGILWLFYYQETVAELQDRPLRDWRVPHDHEVHRSDESVTDEES